ncbi:hypothetical protein H6P81_021411 [Aristolochia fimbriata]|uniref:Uncharacterized protein n=1 Tax=Aristolochia fimbriata TaxID=158543 RepID=A0AAV7DPY3_ARIFI|nr:hypothetical protein H6P81_021411 [Aristolochia fimbriata]
MSRRGLAAAMKTSALSLGGAAVGADLGGSSKYSNENFEGEGERFHVSGTCTWPAHPGSGSAGGRVQRLEEHRRVAWCRCARRPLKIRRTECHTPGRTHNASGLQGKGSRQNGSVTGEKDWLEGWARGPSRTRRLSVDCSSCSGGEAGRRRDAGGDGLREPLGGAFQASNSRLRTECGQGNPTV